MLKLAAVSQRVPDFLSSFMICSTKESGDGWRCGVFIQLINRLNECETWFASQNRCEAVVGDVRWMKKMQTLVFPGFVNRSKPCIGGNTKVVSRLPVLVGVSHRYLKPPCDSGNSIVPALSGCRQQNCLFNRITSD